MDVAALGKEAWFQAFREHAARLAFPDWRPHPEEWVSFYTSMVGPEATITTEVAVYRGHIRMRFRHYSGAEARMLWLDLISAATTRQNTPENHPSSP